MYLSDIILQSAHTGLALQSDKGDFPPGHNGPYYDKETPVRSTSHWLVTMLKAYNISGETTFKKAAYKAAQYLTTSEARPMKATFLCRLNPEKDFCNGLIGQAWVIEALAAATRGFNDDTYLALARELFFIHPFDRNLGLWRRVAVDGSYLSYDATFNHQLWFAASGALIASDEDDEIFTRVSCFLENATKSNLKITHSGRITHLTKINTNPSPIQRFIKNLIYKAKTFNQNRQMIQKEIGYQAFNIYAFAMINSHMPDHPFFQSSKVRSTIAYIHSNEFISGLENNHFGYPYNPCGFEVAYALQVFANAGEKTAKTSQWWISQQLKRTYDFSKNEFSINTADTKTLTARVYEATRLEDTEIRV